MLIENALSDAVRFFHADALSSPRSASMVDYDMALLVVASGLYRLMARRMRGYAASQARQIFPRPDQHTCRRPLRRRLLPPPCPPPHRPGLWSHQPTRQIPWWNNTPLRIIE